MRRQQLLAQPFRNIYRQWLTGAPGLRIRYLAFGLIGAFGIALHASHLTSDLYGDERGHTYNVIAVGDFWANLQDPSMCHPPLYFILAKLAYGVTGLPWSMRIPSLLFSIGTVLLTPLLARRMLGDRYFLPALGLAAFSPFLLEFSAEGRAYAMMIFFSVATLYAFVRFLESENLTSMLTLAGTAIAGALTHYFFWLQLVSLGLYYLIVKRRMSRYAWGALGIVAMVLIPLAAIVFWQQDAQFSQHLQVSWSKNYLSVPNFLARLTVAVNYGYSTFRLPSLDPARNVPLQALWDNGWLLLFVLIAFVGIGYAWIRLMQQRTQWVGFLTWGIGVPVVLSLLASIAGLYLIREKHLAIIWINVYLLLLLAFGYLWRTKYGKFAIACYLIVAAISIVHYTWFPDEYSRRMNWRGLNQALQAQITDADIVVYYTFDPQSLSLGKMSVLDGNRRTVRLATEFAQGHFLREFAPQLHASVDGTIFLINNETERLSIDPGGEFIRTLGSVRHITQRRFGRNLVLYTFQQRPAETSYRASSSEISF